MIDRALAVVLSRSGGQASRALAALLLLCFLGQQAEAHMIVLRGISFSDELGGFVLEQVTGKGSIADPFVVVERMIDPDGATLVFRADPSLGNLIGSPDRIGFALVKVIKNATGHDWSSLEVELQSKLGVPSDHTDELSYGQGSTAGRPFTASAFARITLIDEPFDRIEFEDGSVPAGGEVSLRFVISQPGTLRKAFIAQRPGRPVALRERTAPSVGTNVLPGSGCVAGCPTKFVNQRRQVTLEISPAANRGTINLPAHLVDTRRAYNALTFMERQAALVPGKAAIVEDPAQIAFEILHQRFIAHLQQRPLGQHGAPVIHHCGIEPVVAAEFAEIVAVAQRIADEGLAIG